jgi:hypothetical protein
MAGEIIMSVAYGIDVLPSDDPYVTLAHKAVRTFSIAAVPGVYLVVRFIPPIATIYVVVLIWILRTPSLF